MSWEIDKTFSFCYGHRVWVQELNTEYTEEGHTKPKCRMLHGHEGLVQVFLDGDVDHRGMVEDFVNLGWVKDFLDTVLDHRFILDINDPWFERITDTKLTTNGSGVPTHVTDSDGVTHAVEGVYVPGTQHLTGWNIIPAEGSAGPKCEVLGGFFLVNFVPTSELLCKWLYEAVQIKMDKIGVNVSKISWNETPKSRAVYAPK